MKRKNIIKAICDCDLKRLISLLIGYPEERHILVKINERRNYLIRTKNKYSSDEYIAKLNKQEEVFNFILNNV